MHSRRNTWKYDDRDRRTEKIQKVEYDYLAPDTINEIFTGIDLLSKLKPDAIGNFYAKGFENSDRKTQVVRVPETIELFKELIRYYGTIQIFQHISDNKFSSFDEMKETLQTKIQRSAWINVGGQLIPEAEVWKTEEKYKIKKNEYLATGS